MADLRFECINYKLDNQTNFCKRPFTKKIRGIYHNLISKFQLLKFIKTLRRTSAIFHIYK